MKMTRDRWLTLGTFVTMMVLGMGMFLFLWWFNVYVATPSCMAQCEELGYKYLYGGTLCACTKPDGEPIYLGFN